MRILRGQEEKHLGGLTGSPQGGRKRQTLASGHLIAMVFYSGSSLHSESIVHTRIAYSYLRTQNLAEDGTSSVTFRKLSMKCGGSWCWRSKIWANPTMLLIILFQPLHCLLWRCPFHGRSSLRKERKRLPKSGISQNNGLQTSARSSGGSASPASSNSKPTERMPIFCPALPVPSERHHSQSHKSIKTLNGNTSVI